MDLLTLLLVVAADEIVLFILWRVLRGLTGYLADKILRRRGFDPEGELTPFVDYYPIRNAIFWKPEEVPNKLERS